MVETRRRGHATEDGEVTTGMASVAAAVLDHNGLPVAGVAVTFPAEERPPATALAEAVVDTAATLSRRLHGR
nr:IclR family transcriptional regulator C-terminal domain-containing protein [Nocardioides convexus]